MRWRTSAGGISKSIVLSNFKDCCHRIPQDTLQVVELRLCDAHVCLFQARRRQAQSSHGHLLQQAAKVLVRALLLRSAVVRTIHDSGSEKDGMQF